MLTKFILILLKDISYCCLLPLNGVDVSFVLFYSMLFVIPFWLLQLITTYYLFRILLY